MQARIVSRTLNAVGWSTGTSAGQIDVTFLRDVDHGGPATQPKEVAKKLADFVSQAKASIHIAIYDFRLSNELGSDFIRALTNVANAGLDVKIAYDHTKPNTRTQDAFVALGGDPAPKGTHAKMISTFRGTKVQTKAILTIPESVADSNVGTEPIEGSHLMHNKYIVRDVHTPQACVLTGSTNFTDDAWTHQENNILEIASPALCAYYENDFQELWASGNIASTGVNDLGSVQVGKTSLDVAFAPGEGTTIDAHIAELISSARARIKVASMVITSNRLLGAISDALQSHQVNEFAGIYDAPQMKHVLGMWAKTHNPASGVFNYVAAKMVGKESTPYAPDKMHNFMHNKVVVCDDAVVTGSFNLSGNAEKNAENNLIIHDKKIADNYAAYIDILVKAYTRK